MLEAAAAALAAEETPLLARVAEIDHDQVFWKLGEPVTLDQLKPGDRVFGDPALIEAIAALGLDDVIYVEKGCDVAGGVYRLVKPDDSSKAWHFEPLPPLLQKQKPGVPTHEQAFYDFAMAQGGALPPRTAAWVKWFESTTDGGQK